MSDQHKHEEEGPVVCPWCQTEIVWDEEIGPERNCPHCENELSGYRTLQLDLDDSEGEEEQAGANDSADWEEDGADDMTDFREYNRERLVLEQSMEGVLDDQLEAPECPTCHELMLEAGTQIVTGNGFTPRIPAALGEPILATPFALVLYVCPSCFHTVNRLSVEDQERLVHLLTQSSGSEEL
ncbi:hypothetical protein GZH47_22825 [Paenibacillus rhizovicinus]|uniref:Uncharacterized protein n=1 Tax=Paenibacillus rhizovicinus TaxID=2704463 RepID=A0A6C0P509_9BACL|nr:hypothetical protein [Paenibacillus rhizovicinus]QHW33346.1 hypothetical protein GZH47_22825 [Paenibacillus rhizovicinus]